MTDSSFSSSESLPIRPVAAEIKSAMNGKTPDCPVLVHSLGSTKSVLALAVSSQSIFVAVEDGEILVGQVHRKASY
jgi:hypothetical protein